MISNKFIFESAVISPGEILISLDSSITKVHADNDFTVAAASAEINGTVSDDYGNPVINANVNISSYNGNFHHYVNSDNSGNFYFGIFSDELPQTNLNISSGNYNDTNTVKFSYNIPVINSGDILMQNLFLLKSNSVIQGRLTLNGSSPGVKDIIADCADTGYIRTNTDENGYFKFNVSNKINNYTIKLQQQQSGYNSDSVVAHPGDLNANLNLTLADVKLVNSNIPNKFSLFQNFPNPFNPLTNINFSISKAGLVRLSVYNLLGQEVKTLLNEFKQPGIYTISFDASSLTSGAYFYKLETEEFTHTRKMILSK